MNSYPLWLKIAVAFAAPAFATAAATFPASGRDWSVTLFAAGAAGFGGLAGLLGNDLGKARAASNSGE